MILIVKDAPYLFYPLKTIGGYITIKDNSPYLAMNLKLNSMAVIRFSSLEKINTRVPVNVEPPSKEVADYFGINLFDDKKMQKYLAQDAYDHVKKSISKGMPIDRKMADSVAIGMKSWAVDRGATHYTHWFQPLTGGQQKSMMLFGPF